MIPALYILHFLITFSLHLPLRRKGHYQFPINNPDHLAPPPPYGSISKITNLRHSVGYFLGIDSPLSPIMSSPTVPSFHNDINSETYNTNNTIPAAALRNARYTIHGKSSNTLAVPKTHESVHFVFCPSFVCHLSISFRYGPKKCRPAN